MLEAHVSAKALPRPAARAASRRRTDPIAAIQAGLAAGAVALVLLQFLGVVIYDESPWRFLRMVAALARGPSVIEPDEFDAAIVFTGLALYFALASLYALALSRLVADSPRRYAPAIGLACGIALFFANFHGFTALFPWFVPYRTVDTFLVHAFFGACIARAYGALRRR